MHTVFSRTFGFNGGAVYVLKCKLVKILSSTFKHSSAGVNGGALELNYTKGQCAQSALEVDLKTNVGVSAGVSSVHQ